MQSRYLRVVVCLLLLTAVSSVSADNVNAPPEERSLYATGKRLMREGDYHGAARTFEEMAGRFQNSEYVDLYIFHRAKAKYYFGDYDEAIGGFNYFISHFIFSKELPYAHFYMGNAYYLKGDVDRAVQSFFDAFGISGDNRLNQILLSSIASAVEHAASVEFAASDFENIPSSRRCMLAESIARAFNVRGDTLQAQGILAFCNGGQTGTIPDSDKRTRRGEIKIAVVLPFSGELQQYSDEIYNGAVIAAENFRDETNRSVEVVAYDTKGDPIDAARIISELSEDNSIIATIGPLTSEEAAVASASLVCGDLPLLVPAATQAGLTRLSATSFQLSPNIELQGNAMADYAVANLKADSAAIITSTATDYLRMSKAFADRFEQLGGKVIAIEYYRPRDKDFGPQISDIKRELLGVFPDSVYYITPGGDTLELDELPAFVDCLYLPGRPEQIKLLVPQINFYNLNGSYLGSDGWADEKIYRLGDKVTKAAVFPSPFLAKENSEANLRFSAAYDNRYGKRPERLAALGYDALWMISTAFADGGGNRAKLVRKLSQFQQYSGASGTVTFGAHRENIDMPLYRIENGRAIPVAESDQAAELTDTNR